MDAPTASNIGTIPTTFRKLTTAQIGRLGELVVQTKLLELGIDSAPTTTDSGIDLLALTPRGALAIQIKTCLKPKPSGGKGRLANDWYVEVADDSQVDVFAFVRYDTQEVWMVRPIELEEIAQQRVGRKYHFYMYVEPSRRAVNRHFASEFDYLLIGSRSDILFGS